jgi:replicative DNA helicase
LTVVGGRAGVGKTSFICQVAVHAALEGKSVALASAQEKGEELTNRILSQLAMISRSRIEAGRVLQEDWPRLKEALERFARAPLVIHPDEPEIEIPRLEERIRRRAESEGNIELLVVDSLQLLRPSRYSHGLESARVGAIARELKQLAARMDMAILASASADPGRRADKRLRLHDFLGSGEIEDHADLVLFLHREDLDDPDTPLRGIAEIQIAKNRLGPTDMVRVTFIENFSRFGNLVSG